MASSTRRRTSSRELSGTWPPAEVPLPGEPAGADAFAWIDAGGTVLGHVSYGPDGRIPTVENYPYSEDCLDMGLGLRPDLCGRGLGIVLRHVI